MDNAAMITALVGLAAALLGLAGVWVQMRTLRPNGGASLADAINRIDSKVDHLAERVSRIEGALGVERARSQR